MKRGLAYLLLATIASSFVAKSQTNMVPNSSFEVYTSCPNGPSQIMNAQPWNGPPLFSTDYYNVCGNGGYSIPNNISGTETAKTGNAYAGIYLFVNSLPNARDYIEALLTDTLQSGMKYCVRFFVSLADSFTYAVSNISAYFSSNGIGTNQAQIFTYTPQINNPTANIVLNKNGWTMVLDSFLAVGNERFIAIGNFKDDPNTDTLFVGGAGWGAAYYYIDEIWVGLCDSMVGIGESVRNEINMKVYPNPASSIITLEMQNLPPDASDLRIEFYNVIGGMVREAPLHKTELSQTISLPGLQEGVYLYRIICENEIYTTRKLMISR